MTRGGGDAHAVGEEPLPDNLQRIEPGDVVKVKELGRGQFGSVWLGKWLGIQVAMKELHSSDGRSRQELVAEAEMLASLRHPCVVAFYGVVAAAPLLPPLTVTEFMCDGSLRSALIRLRQDKHFMVRAFSFSSLSLFQQPFLRSREASIQSQAVCLRAHGLGLARRLLHAWVVQCSRVSVRFSVTSYRSKVESSRNV